MEKHIHLRGYHCFDIPKVKKMNYEKPVIVGIDSETLEGPPITLQLYSEDQRNLTRLLWVNEKNCTRELMRTFDHFCKPDVSYVIYGHNLAFDFVSFFWQNLTDITANQDRTFDFTFGAWTITGVYGTPTFARMLNGKKRVLIVDSYSWFRSSLEKAAELVCPHLPKLARPDGLGTKQFTRKDTAFAEYAMRDAEVAYHLGCAVDELHQEYDLRQAVSLADMSATIFRKHYIADPIVRTGRDIAKAAIFAYHGGKNNVIGEAAPGMHVNVTSYDISSAYPHAMTQLPSFTKSECFSGLRVFSPRSRSVPPVGIYRITGTVADCAWPSLYGHDFKPLSGKVQDVWLHGYELNEALRTDEVRLKVLCGYVYDCDRDPGNDTAFSRFVRTFYDLKSSAKSETHRWLYKVILNSLYGKFIQTKDVVHDENGVKVIRKEASVLFHPFVAASITAHTRAVIHQLEHHTNALHTATDGVFVPGVEPRTFPFAPSQGLGSITRETSGDLFLMRSKLYVLQTQEHVKGSYPSFYRPGWRVAKIAKHGFQGSNKQLEHCIFSGARKYTVEQPYRLRAALKGGHVPNKWVKRDLVLKVPPLKRRFTY
jgi:hypothetical protein